LSEYQIKLSPYAKIFYTEWLLDPENTNYNLTIDQTLYGDLNIYRLKKSLIRYIKDHVVLNSHIQEINGFPYWVKNDRIVGLEYSDHEIAFNELRNYIGRKFDLYNGPLYRFKLIRIKNGVWRLITVFHHILVDGSSAEIGIFNAITNYYNDDKYTTEYALETQIQLLNGLAEVLFAKLENNKTAHKKFWCDQLLGIDPIDLNFLRLNTKQALSQQSNNPIGVFYFNYEEKELVNLNKIKRRYVITPYIYNLCVFALLLNKYTKQNRLAISYPVLIKEGLNYIYGAQVNTNLIPYVFNETTSIIDLFNQSKHFFNNLKQERVNHSYYTIENILQNKNNHLLDISFIQANFKKTKFSFQGIAKVDTQNEFNIDSLKYFIFEQDLQDYSSYRVRYNKENINEKLLNNFIATYQRLFNEILDDLLSDNIKKITDYSLLTKEQYQQIVYDWNQTEQLYPKDKTIHQLFEEQTLRTPNNTAIVFGDKKLTYQELNTKANQLAHYLLIQYQIRADDLIALYLGRSELILIAILAVLKAGAAYVPIEMTYPDERIKYILDDTDAKVVLTNKTYENYLLSIKGNIEILSIDTKDTQHQLIKQDLVNPITATKSNNLIYVIYTSGTTGNPKGVMQQHDNVMRLFTATNAWYNFTAAWYNFTANDTWTLFHSYAFDFSVWEIWGALLYGGKLIITTKEQCIDTNAFYELCAKHEVTVLNQTPQAFYNFIDIAAKNFNHKLLSLRYVIFGGEALNYTNLLPWTALYGYNRPKLINMYGITETTVHVTYKEISREDIGLSSNIGTVIPDQKIFVLDANLSPLPLGVAGELYVGGEGLARGYLNQPKLTALRFIANPFQTPEEKAQNLNNRLYKTGDLARRLPDGSLEYVGRNDDQVKIRGFRIELGEIENALLKYSGITKAVVVIEENKDKTDKYIVAYYVAEKELNQEEVSNYLITQIPEYMLPSIIIYINNLPLTANGKVDRAALPKPKFESVNKYVAPTNEKEKLLCEAFSKVLGIERFGINDDFFKLGGNSLKAITLTSILQSNFNIKVADIFNLRTPFNLSKELKLDRDIIYKKLEEIKAAYKKIPVKELSRDEPLSNKVNDYLESIKALQLDYSALKPISKVLLTGATGFLGCNLLNQLLQLTNYKIYLLIRAQSQEQAIERINHKFQFYFSKNLDNVLNTRVFVLKSDIEDMNLGLSPPKYQELTERIDSIIHSAALVKHYGDQEVFYSANVQATINLLEFAKLTQLKDFHYISTISTLQLAKPVKNGQNTYIEDDVLETAVVYDNVYVQTKLQGEHQVIKYRDYGVTSNIYRVGNLAFIAENGRVQENVEDNAFLTCVKFYLKIKCIAKEFDLVEISPVDTTATAIVKLFNKKQLENKTYHVFNPYLSNISKIFLNESIVKIDVLPLKIFIERIIDYLNSNNYNELIFRFLLHKGWIDGLDENSSNVNIMQDKTLHILKRLDFEWTQISKQGSIYYLLK